MDDTGAPPRLTRLPFHGPLSEARAAGLVLATAAGFRPAWIESATCDEWEHFESAYQSDVEEWLAATPTIRWRRRPATAWTATGACGSAAGPA